MSEKTTDRPQLVAVPGPEATVRGPRKGAPSRRAIAAHPAGGLRQYVAVRPQGPFSPAANGRLSELATQVRRFEQQVADLEDRLTGPSRPSDAEVVDEGVELIRRGNALRVAVDELGAGVRGIPVSCGIEGLTDWLRGLLTVFVERPMTVEMEQLLRVRETLPRPLRLASKNTNAEDHEPSGLTDA